MRTLALSTIALLFAIICPAHAEAPQGLPTVRLCTDLEWANFNLTMDCAKRAELKSIGDDVAELGRLNREVEARVERLNTEAAAMIKQYRALSNNVRERVLKVHMRYSPGKGI